MGSEYALVVWKHDLASVGSMFHFPASKPRLVNTLGPPGRILLLGPQISYNSKTVPLLVSVFLFSEGFPVKCKDDEKKNYPISILCGKFRNNLCISAI